MSLKSFRLKDHLIYISQKELKWHHAIWTNVATPLKEALKLIPLNEILIKRSKILKQATLSFYNVGKYSITHHNYNKMFYRVLF